MVMAGTDQRSLDRASRSLRCLPFRRGFYEAVGHDSLSSQELASSSDWARLSFRPLSAEQAEEHFLWLIRLGVLRREVDGQGLTERVRLTPMGRKVLRDCPAEIRRAGRRERILEALRRYRPLC